VPEGGVVGAQAAMPRGAGSGDGSIGGFIGQEVSAFVYLVVITADPSRCSQRDLCLFFFTSFLCDETQKPKLQIELGTLQATIRVNLFMICPPREPWSIFGQTPNHRKSMAAFGRGHEIGDQTSVIICSRQLP
jgi:hypothetical protein